jgi:hypothetical protein
MTMRWLAALLLAGAFGCAHKSPKAEKPIYKGYVRLGPEQVSFQPCGEPRAKRWWLAETQGHEGWKEVAAVLDAQPECDLGKACQLQQAYVEIEGKLSPPGSYGQMGMYERQITPIRFLSAAYAGPNDCRQPSE